MKSPLSALIFVEGEVLATYCSREAAHGVYTGLHGMFSSNSQSRLLVLSNKRGTREITLFKNITRQESGTKNFIPSFSCFHKRGQMANSSA